MVIVSAGRVGERGNGSHNKPDVTRMDRRGQDPVVLGDDLPGGQSAVAFDFGCVSYQVDVEAVSEHRTVSRSSRVAAGGVQRCRLIRPADQMSAVVRSGQS